MWIKDVVDVDAPATVSKSS